MGKKSQTDDDWEDDELMDGDDLDAPSVDDPATTPANSSRLTWRLIEQAREARVLREQLADFNDYV